MGPVGERRQTDFIPLKDYIETKIASVEKATVVALESMDKRLESMNEFRATLKDQASTFITKADITALQKDIQDLRESRAELRGKASMASVYISYGLAVLGLLLSVLSLFRK
jgi:hypothetical protein